MKPKALENSPEDDLFRSRLDNIINLHHELVKLGELHTKAFHGAPYDGHTLNEVIEELETQTGITNERSYVDKGLH